MVFIFEAMPVALYQRRCNKVFVESQFSGGSTIQSPRTPSQMAQQFLFERSEQLFTTDRPVSRDS